MVEFLEDDDSNNLRTIVDELLEDPAGLTDWEIVFLEKMKFKWIGTLTVKQGQWIEDIYKRFK